jgi:hypothetical protein
LHSLLANSISRQYNVYVEILDQEFFLRKSFFLLEGVMVRIFLPFSIQDKLASRRVGVLPSLLLIVVPLTLLSGACGSQTSHSDHQSNGQASNQAAASSTPRVPAFISNLAEAGPLPTVLDPKQFTDPVIVKTYRFAAENPEIFAQQPCYCHCDTSEGHKGLLDCFATTHGAT